MTADLVTTHENTYRMPTQDEVKANSKPCTPAPQLLSSNMCAPCSIGSCVCNVCSWKSSRARELLVWLPCVRRRVRGRASRAADHHAKVSRSACMRVGGGWWQARVRSLARVVWVCVVCTAGASGWSGASCARTHVLTFSLPPSLPLSLALSLSIALSHRGSWQAHRTRGYTGGAPACPVSPLESVEAGDIMRG